MKCEKCGFLNSEYDIICEKCGSPLNIEKNIELQKKYNHKQAAIDIEEVTIDNEEARFDNTKQKVKYILFFVLGIIFTILIITIISIIGNIKENDIISKYDKFINNEIGLIYLGDNSDINKYIEEYSKDYSLEYLYIKTNKVTAVKRNRLKSKLKLKKLDSTLVVISNGEVLNYEHGIDSKEQITKFLKENDVIPADIEKSNDVISKFDNSINSKEATIMYIANNKNDLNEKHNKNLEKFCDDYSINYVYIEGYYLTDNQKLRLLRKVNYSDIHNELLVIIDEGTVKEVSESISNYQKDYFALASSYGIIDTSSADSLKKIDYNNVQQIVDSGSKSVIFFSESECIYCDRLKPIIGKLSIQNNFDVYYHQIEENNKDSLEEYLKNIGYNEEKITVPLVVVVENKNILDYIIGLSDKTLYEEKFKELGVMR